ncbi:cupin domain-containing protein [Kitasatospora sp. NPDC051853]|uniref:cupin domain-containing protein n=1 Tax=Kitasatospora sp. NPDC051853 TaxID=3364058 RepID=UPI0037875168
MSDTTHVHAVPRQRDGESIRAGGDGARGISSAPLARGSHQGVLPFRPGGDTDVVVGEVVIAPGGTTGWHYHPGPVLAVVRSGTLTRQLADGTVETTEPGGVVFEPAGPAYPHVGHNHGTEPVVLMVTYLTPAGCPLSVDAPAPAWSEAG